METPSMGLASSEVTRMSKSKAWSGGSPKKFEQPSEASSTARVEGRVERGRHIGTSLHDCKCRAHFDSLRIWRGRAAIRAGRSSAILSKRWVLRTRRYAANRPTSLVSLGCRPNPNSLRELLEHGNCGNHAPPSHCGTRPNSRPGTGNAETRTR